MKRKKDSRPSSLRKCDDAFSLFIRTRDSQEYGCKAFKCISCGQIKPIEQADCGHYINRKHLATRFSETNCNAQCRKCNRFDEGNMSGYRQGLVLKYGERRVCVLELQKSENVSFTASVLDIMTAYYKQETKKFEHQIEKKK